MSRLRTYGVDGPVEGCIATSRGLAPVDKVAAELVALDAGIIEDRSHGWDDRVLWGEERRAELQPQLRYYQRLPNGNWLHPDGREVASAWAPEREAGVCAHCGEPMTQDGVDEGVEPMCDRHYGAWRAERRDP